jgi:hypothetical protein
MFDWLRYRYQLALLQRKKRQTERYFAKAWNKAKEEKKSEDDLREVVAERNHEIDVINDDIPLLSG